MTLAAMGKTCAIISWVSWFQDFKDGELHLGGPTYDLHHAYYGKARPHEKHLILSTGPEGDTRSDLLLAGLRQHFPAHEVELQCLDVLDPYDFQELKLRSERALESLAGYDEIDILFSNGTSPMSTVWVILHLEQNAFTTRLIQGVQPRPGEDRPQFQEVQIDSSLFAHRIRILTRSVGALPSDKEPLRLSCLEEAYSQADKIAAVEVSTLIEGESGTGKEVMAQYLHRHSSRKRRPMISINCAAMRDDLLETRLFGYVKHSFTDAKDDRKGLFEEADKSSLFLDEIGDISPYMQQALLRVLQEQEVTPVGGSTTRQVDVRVIAATNKDLWAECQAGRFRWDLYYRLTQTRLRLPAFRDYPLEDRQAFIDHFLAQKARLFERPELRLSQAARTLLLAHPFPGNVRELENVLIHCYVFAEGEVDVSELPEDLRVRYQAEDLSMETAMRRHARRVFEACGQNYSQATKLLGVARNTLKKYLEPPPPSQPD